MKGSTFEKSPDNLHQVCSILEKRYRSPLHYNKRDPFNELIFIVCSLRTTEDQYRAAYNRVKTTYPKHSDLLRARKSDLAKQIGDAGLGNQKAKCLILCARRIASDFGKVSLAPLKKLGDDECEVYLISLPRIGLKAARCVMMYALGRTVFPVDTHCWRIGVRLGWIRNSTGDNQPRQREMNRFQDKIPVHLRRSLHVNLVALGRDFCRSNSPKCGICPLVYTCKKIGVAQSEVLGG